MKRWTIAMLIITIPHSTRSMQQQIKFSCIPRHSPPKLFIDTIQTKIRFHLKRITQALKISADQTIKRVLK